MSLVDRLLGVGQHLSIVHHTKGRVRFRASSKIEEYAKDFTLEDVKNLPNSIRGIESIKVNKLIGSITLQYDNELIAPTVWEELVSMNISKQSKETLESLLEEQEAQYAK